MSNQTNTESFCPTCLHGLQHDLGPDELFCNFCGGNMLYDDNDGELYCELCGMDHSEGRAFSWTEITVATRCARCIRRLRELTCEDCNQGLIFNADGYLFCEYCDDADDETLVGEADSDQVDNAADSDQMDVAADSDAMDISESEDDHPTSEVDAMATDNSDAWSEDERWSSALHQFLLAEAELDAMGIDVGDVWSHGDVWSTDEHLGSALHQYLIAESDLREAITARGERGREVAMPGEER